MNLTPHFTLEEMIASQTAARNALDNMPDPQAVAHLTILCETILEPARAALGPLHITSGYRSPAVNVKVGGSRTSAHCLGWAADVVPLKVSKKTLAEWIQANCKWDQLIFEFGSVDEPQWIHCSADPRYRRQVLRILADGKGYRPVTL